MAATYYQRGESLDYTNSSGSKISAGDVIELGDRIAIAGCDMADGTKGAVEVVGVFLIEKTGTNAISMGTNVYFDGDGITDAADDGGNPATAYTPAGFAAAAAAADATEILVKIG